MNANVEVVGTLNEIEGYRVQFKEVFAEAATLDCPCDLTKPELRETKPPVSSDDRRRKKTLASACG